MTPLLDSCAGQISCFWYSTNMYYICLRVFLKVFNCFQLKVVCPLIMIDLLYVKVLSFFVCSIAATQQIYVFPRYFHTLMLKVIVFFRRFQYFVANSERVPYVFFNTRYQQNNSFPRLFLQYMYIKNNCFTMCFNTLTLKQLFAVGFQLFITKISCFPKVCFQILCLKIVSCLYVFFSCSFNKCDALQVALCLFH